MKVNHITQTRDEWIEQGKRLYGEDMKAWKFVCPRCGNVQSHYSVTERNPEAKDTHLWIYFSCEGRHTKNVGCDWTLGGLFQIHKKDVIDEDGEKVPCMLFADE